MSSANPYPDDADTFDVIVVGAGGSGLAAAVSAAEHGLSVLLLEKRPTLGGATGIAVGSFTANRTDHQRRSGIEDDPRTHNEDAGKFAPAEIEARGNSALREYFLTHTAETLRWLESFGLRFHGPSPEPPNRVPRMHNVVPNAKAYIAALQSQLLRRGGTIRVNASVERLMVEEGRVVGVEVAADSRAFVFCARHGVVLAAGDYANNPEIISQYKGADFAAVEGINPHATGDGHRLAESVGAALVNMDITYGPELRFIAPRRRPFAQLLPASGIAARLMGAALPLMPRRLVDAMIKRLLVTWQHPENALFTDGAILINANGERFCRELESPAREIAVAHQPGKIAYMLLDEPLIERYSAWPHFISTAPRIAYAYVADYLRLRPDVAIEAATLDELAARRQLPATLKDAIASDGRSDLPGPSRALHGNRWVLLGPVKAYFTTTEGGAAINTSFEVLDAHQHPIPGLYAVGQNGLSGQILWGHGLHIAWAITSGRLVGKRIAESA